MMENVKNLVLQIVNGHTGEISAREVINRLPEPISMQRCLSYLSQLRLKGKIGRNGRGRYHKLDQQKTGRVK